MGGRIPNGARPGGRLPKGESRRKLIAAALRHFAEQPYEDVTVGAITRSAGVAHGLLFHYFGNKRSLYLACLEEAAGALNGSESTDPAAAPGARVRHMFRSFLVRLAGGEHFALVSIVRGIGNDAQAWQIFDETRWQMITWACQQLDLDAERPSIRLAWRAFSRAADEITINRPSEDAEPAIDAVVEWLVEMLVGALRAAHKIDPEADVGSALDHLRHSTKI